LTIQESHSSTPQEGDQKANDDPIEPVLPVLLLPGDAAAEQEEDGHSDRRRGGDSGEGRERVPVRVLTGREEGRGDDLRAGGTNGRLVATVAVDPAVSSAPWVTYVGAP
jgi:hypothetical protein